MEDSETKSQDSGRKRRREEERQVPNSETVEANIQQIQQKMEQFTQLVSGLLESAKALFNEVANTFEDGIVQLHQKQIEKWEDEVQLLRTIDSMNEETNSRLSNAQSLMSALSGAC